MALKEQTWLIVGASRGIGLEYVRQLLDLNHKVLATARSVESAKDLWTLTGTPNGKYLTILECDVTKEQSITALKESIAKMSIEGGLSKIDTCVLNAGILEYPNRISELSFENFSRHLSTNTIGPLICAAALLSLSKPTPMASPIVPVSTLVFTSSDSGSAANFRAFEDGFGAYAASKAALNQGLRHLAAEQARFHKAEPINTPIILAIHPGEVSTDMAAGVNVEWEVEGIITAQESVAKMLVVIDSKGKGGSEVVVDAGRATFWDWEGRSYPW